MIVHMRRLTCSISDVRIAKYVSFCVSSSVDLGDVAREGVDRNETPRVIGERG